MLVEAVLDLRRKDGLPTRHHHVGVAALDEPPVALATAYVARGRETAKPRFVITVGVARERRGRTGEDATGRAGFDVVVVLVDEPQGDAAHDPAGRGRSGAE